MLHALSSFICSLFGCKPRDLQHGQSVTKCLRCSAKLTPYVLLFLLAGCATGQFHRGVQSTPVIVDNRNFYDAKIRIDGRRIGSVTGHTLDTLSVSMVGNASTVLVELIGGAGSIELGTFVLDGRELHIQIWSRLISSQAWVQ